MLDLSGTRDPPNGLDVASRDRSPSSCCTRLLKRILVLCLTAPILVAGDAKPFHEGGVASCGGCHILHESEDGLLVVDASDPLLRGGNSTDVCLGCHAEGNLGVFGLDPLDPPPERGGGNFVFLLEDNLNDAPDGLTNPIAGEAAGHNVVAASFGVGPDTRWSTAPGGTFSSSQLGCTSCHDPHGNASFRMLLGTGPIQGGSFVFTSPAPDAVGLDLQGADPSESPTQHTAYRDGMSEWCGNCHGPDYHRRSTTAFQHPSNQAIGKYANRYAIYAGDDDPAGGDPSTSYLPEVSFEDPAMTTTTTSAPAGFSRVTCLTCHRAHASSAPAAGRWDFDVTRLDQDGLVSGSYPLPNPYPGPNQGTLCAKCHAADDPGPEPLPEPIGP